MIYVRRVASPVTYYMKDEAQKMGIGYIPWRAITCVGQWMLTDDDVVVECTRYKEIRETRGKKKISVRTRRLVGNAVSYGYTHGKTPLTFLDFVEKKACGLVPDEWWKSCMKKNPKLLKLFVMAVLHGFPLQHRIHTFLNGSQRYMYARKDWDVFYAIEKRLGNKTINARNIKVLYSTDGVKNMIRKDIARIVEEKNIDAEEVFNIIGEALVIARKKESAKDLLGVADRYAAILAMPHTQRASAQTAQGQLMPPSSEDTDRMFDSILNAQKTEVEDAVVINEGK